jgi:AcrR family transcriptional regulator
MAPAVRAPRSARTAVAPAAARRGSPAPAATRDRLLRAGLAVARKGGLRAITVRALAQRAGANTGSFVYHFGTREAFLSELVEQWYAPLMTQLQLQAAHEDPDPLQTLRAMVLQMVHWARSNAGFLAQLLMDAAAGEVAAQRFFGGLEGRHPALLLAAIVAAQKAGRLRPAPPLALLLFLMSAVALPVLLFQGFDAARVLRSPFVEKLRFVVADSAQAEQRLEWALRGLAPDEEA